MKKKLSRPQEIVLYLILIIISAAVISWAFYNPYRTPTFRTSGEALEYELDQLGITKPYDIIADYSFNSDNEYSCNRQIYVRTNMFDDEVSVCVSLDQAGSKWKKRRYNKCISN